MSELNVFFCFGGNSRYDLLLVLTCQACQAVPMWGGPVHATGL